MLLPFGLSFRSPDRRVAKSQRDRQRTPSLLERLEDRRLLSGGLTASMVADFVPGAESFSPIGLANANGTLFFSTFGGLWTSDGTPAGTREIATRTSSDEITPVGDSVFYFSGDSLW